LLENERDEVTVYGEIRDVFLQSDKVGFFVNLEYVTDVYVKMPLDEKINTFDEAICKVCQEIDLGDFTPEMVSCGVYLSTKNKKIVGRVLKSFLDCGLFVPVEMENPESLGDIEDYANFYGDQPEEYTEVMHRFLDKLGEKLVEGFSL
jgi:hypothetical protein